MYKPYRIHGQCKVKTPYDQAASSEGASVSKILILLNLTKCGDILRENLNLTFGWNGIVFITFIGLKKIIAL